MICDECSSQPDDLKFDISIAVLGYEKRCRWVVESNNIEASKGVALEFGFLQEHSYEENKKFFEGRSYQLLDGLSDDTIANIASILLSEENISSELSIFIDISSMSREMISNVALAIEQARKHKDIIITAAYSPSRFLGSYESAPIRKAEPLHPGLAGWSSQPYLPLAAVFGLGCEPGLALGALQYIEPDRAWIYYPTGEDESFNREVKKTNENIREIYDVVEFDYDLQDPVITRGRVEALINTIEKDFRIIMIPFGPKIFSWLVISTVVFGHRKKIGIWTFSSKERGLAVDREAAGEIIWHRINLSKISDLVTA